MILSVSGLSYYYADTLVFKDVGFAVQDNDRVGIVGDNGSGKTTLLKLLVGELVPFEGEIAFQAGATTGYLTQASQLDNSHTLWDEILTANNCSALGEEMRALEQRMGTDPELLDKYSQLCSEFDSAGGYDIEYRAKKILTGLNFPETMYDERVGSLSGGERTRLSMAKLLLENPDLIILDEPTNHLDAQSVDWLGGFLSEYRGAVIIVSHNTEFLDRVCNRILEVALHRATFYNGNYSAYALQKEMNAESDERLYQKNKKRADELADYAKRNMARASTTNMAKSRLKMLSRIDLTRPENLAHERISFRFTETDLPYKDLLICRSLVVGAGGNELFKCPDFTLLRGENLAIIGANGTGKTSLLKTILGKNPPVSGRIRFGGGVRFSYYEQNIFTGEQRSAFDYLWSLYPSLSQQQVRDMLATVGLRGEEVFIPVHRLSGGEQARLMLLRLSLQRPNVLILDEPTNHLDKYSHDILCDTLKHFFGTLIVVTHDLELVQMLGCRVLAIGSGNAEIFESYKHYAIASGKLSSAEKSVAYATLDGEKYTKTDELPAENSLSQKEIRRISAEKRRRLAELNALIPEKEGTVRQLEAAINDPANSSDPIRLTQLCESLDAEKAELDELSTEWLGLTD